MTERGGAYEDDIGLAVEKVRRLGKEGRLVLLGDGACPLVVSIRYPDQSHVIEPLQDGQIPIAGNPARADDTDLHLGHRALPITSSKNRRLAAAVDSQLKSSWTRSWAAAPIS